MINISIKHNPFTVETTFLVDGKQPADNVYSEFLTQRFQQWVERLFTELSKKNNGAKKFKVTFQGLESDYLDLVVAAKKAEKEGFEIQLEFQKAENADTRLKNILELVEEAKNHPLLRNEMQTNTKILSDLNASFNKEFDIYVVATMSAGKSTLINAMLGADLLPAANEATTSTIAKIYDTDMPIGEFHGERRDFNNRIVSPMQSINLQMLKDWNIQEDTAVININANISGMEKRNHVQLVLSDTPGINNSQNEKHKETTITHLKDGKKNPIILYVLNATTLGVDDDKNTLTTISEKMKESGVQNKDRFIFVINKMDQFNPEEENIESTIERTKEYLKKNGIESPNVYPISAYLARLIRKDNNKQKLTKGEDGDFYSFRMKFNPDKDDNYEGIDFNLYMNLPQLVKDKLKNGNYDNLELRSGLPAVEKTIDTYIEKYNVPERVFRAYRALNNAIKECSNEEKLTISLKADQVEIDKLKESIESIKKVQRESANTDSYLNDLKEKGIGLPDETIRKLNESERKVNTLINNLSGLFVGKGEVATAINRLNQVQNDVNYARNDIIVTYNNIIKQMDELMKDELEKIYKEYVKKLFKDVNTFEVPQLYNVQLQIENAIVKKLDNKEIEKEEVFSHYETVDVSTWWKPWTKIGFGGTEQRARYKTVEYVDLEELWESRGKDISMKFTQFTSKATKDIERRQAQLVEQYIQFMDAEFTPRFNEIISDLENKMKDQKLLEKKVKQAKENLEEIERFKQKVAEVIKL